MLELKLSSSPPFLSHLTLFCLDLRSPLHNESAFL